MTTSGSRSAEFRRRPEGPDAGSDPSRPVQRAAAPVPDAQPEAAELVDAALASDGQPLDRETRAFMEPRFGHDFSRVRIHSDPTANASARGVSAHAYTVGQHIVFGAGQYNPATPSGQRLLAHELTHVVQQAAGPAAPQTNALEISDPGDPQELAADAAAEAVLSGETAAAQQPHPTGVRRRALQRQPAPPATTPPPGDPAGAAAPKTEKEQLWDALNRRREDGTPDPDYVLAYKILNHQWMRIMLVWLAELHVKGHLQHLHANIGRAEGVYTNRLRAAIEAVHFRENPGGRSPEWPGWVQKLRDEGSGDQADDINQAAGVNPLPAAATGADLSEAEIAAATAWAARENLAPEAIRELQAKLGVYASGAYDRVTAINVYLKQREWQPRGRIATPGQATKDVFARLGLMSFRAITAATVGDAEVAQIQQQFPAGVTITIYANYDYGGEATRANNAEFFRQAQVFATNQRSVGMKGGAVALGVPMPVDEASQTIEIVQAIHRGLVAKWRSSQPQDAAPAAPPPWTRVRNLALFAHGESWGMGLNKSNAFMRGGIHSSSNELNPANVQAFVKGLQGALAGDVAVQLFACSVAHDDARAPADGWGKPDEGGRYGANSVAANLANALGPNASVYGHITVGHTTENYAARVFGAGAGGGQGGVHLFDVMYPAEFIDSELTRLFPAKQEMQRAALRGPLRDQMWRHYIDSIQGDHFRTGKAKRYPVPMGQEMFVNPENARRLMQQDWQTNWIPTRTADVERAALAPAPRPPVQRKALDNAPAPTHAFSRVIAGSVARPGRLVQRQGDAGAAPAPAQPVSPTTGVPVRPGTEVAEVINALSGRSPTGLAEDWERAYAILSMMWIRPMLPALAELQKTGTLIRLRTNINRARGIAVNRLLLAMETVLYRDNPAGVSADYPTWRGEMQAAGWTDQIAELDAWVQGHALSFGPRATTVQPAPAATARQWPTLLPTTTRTAQQAIQFNVSTDRRNPAEPTGGRLDIGPATALDDQRWSIVKYIAQQRAAQTTSVGLIWGGAYQNWTYGRLGDPNNPAQNPTPTEVTTARTAQAGGTANRQQQIVLALWEEFGHEGSSASVNTYDTALVTWGRGWAARHGQLGETLDVLFQDAGARERFLDVGINYVNGQYQAVNTLTGGIETGDNALRIIQLDQKLNSFLWNFATDPSISPSTRATPTDPGRSYQQLWADAQWTVARQHAANVPAYAQTWDLLAIRLVAHISHWWPAVGWAAGYAATNGDITAIVRRFGTLAGRARASGAIVHNGGADIGALHSSRFPTWANGAAMGALHPAAALPADIEQGPNTRYAGRVYLAAGNIQFRQVR